MLKHCVIWNICFLLVLFNVITTYFLLWLICRPLDTFLHECCWSNAVFKETLCILIRKSLLIRSDVLYVLFNCSILGQLFPSSVYFFFTGFDTDGSRKWPFLRGICDQWKMDSYSCALHSSNGVSHQLWQSYSTTFSLLTFGKFINRRYIWILNILI